MEQTLTHKWVCFFFSTLFLSVNKTLASMGSPFHLPYISQALGLAGILDDAGLESHSQKANVCAALVMKPRSTVSSTFRFCDWADGQQFLQGKPTRL